MQRAESSGVPVFVSSQLASGSPLTPTSVFVYDAPQVVLVRRQDLCALSSDRSRSFNSDKSEIRAILRAESRCAESEGRLRDAAVTTFCA